MSMKRRDFLAAGIALNIGSAIALAEQAAAPRPARCPGPGGGAMLRASERSCPWARLRGLSRWGPFHIDQRTRSPSEAQPGVQGSCVPGQKRDSP